MRELWAALTATVMRDTKVFLSYRTRAVSMVLGMLMSLTMFYYVSRLVRVEPFDSPDAYYAFAVVGLVILQVLNSTLGGPAATLRGELMTGTFERLVVSPLGPIGGLILGLVFPFVFSLVSALVMLTLAGLIFGLDVRWETVPLAAPVGALGAIAFMPFGIALVAVTVLVKQAAAGVTWIIAGISLIAGLYFPTSLLPDWIEWASDVQPFTPAVELLRNVLVGTPLQRSAWLDVVILIGFSAVLLPPAVWALSAAVRRAQKTGTITEY